MYKENKYTFMQFLAAIESENFDNIDKDKYKFHALQYVNEISDNMIGAVHEGDCTKESTPCFLCLLQYHLEEYKEYYFNEEKWRVENGLA